MTVVRILRSGALGLLKNRAAHAGRAGQCCAFSSGGDVSRLGASEVSCEEATADERTGQENAENAGVQSDTSSVQGVREGGQSFAQQVRPDISRSIFKATLLGEVGTAPTQKVLKSGRAVTMFKVATGGMRNLRQPFSGESLEEFSERGRTQWHRVAVYNAIIGAQTMQALKPGGRVYVEGNIETRVFTDPHTGLVKRVKEIAVRSQGHVFSMDAVGRSSPHFPLPRAQQESVSTHSNLEIPSNVDFTASNVEPSDLHVDTTASSLDATTSKAAVVLT